MESDIHVALRPEVLGHVFMMPITNSLIMTWAVMVLLLVLVVLFRRSLSLVPGRIQAGIEASVEAVLGYMSETLGSEKLARTFFPLVASIGIFVALANVLEFLPGIGSIGLEHGAEFLPLLRAPAADLNFTLALAAIAFFTIEITSIAALGTITYISKYLNFASPIGFIVGLIEFISNLGRLISFSFRLFGNIFAGEVLVLVATFFVPYILPAPLMLFEMFIGVIQGIVFAMLTLFFIKLAIMKPHEAH